MELTVEVCVHVEDIPVTPRAGTVCVQQVYMIWAAARVRLFSNFLCVFSVDIKLPVVSCRHCATVIMVNRYNMLCPII